MDDKIIILSAAKNPDRDSSALPQDDTVNDEEKKAGFKENL